MRKFIVYAIIIFIFVLPINCFCKENGFVWLPLAWTFTIDKENSDNSEIVIKSVKLVFQEKDSKKFEYSELKYTNKKSNSFTLNDKNQIKTLLSKKLFEMPEGNFEFKGIQLEVINRENVVSNYELEAPNPYKNSKYNYINFAVKNSHISPVPELSFESKLRIKEGAINRSSTQVDLIENDYIYINDIFNQIKSLNKLIFDNKITFINANSEFPPLQVDGTKMKYSHSNFVGMIIDISCDIKGIIKTVWVNKSDYLQYVFYENLNQKKENCKVHDVIPQKYYLPNGNWTMQSLTINLKNKVDRKFNTLPLVNKNKEVRKYFKITDEFFKYQDIKERTLLKIIELNLTNKLNPDGLYFLGSAEIKKSDAEDMGDEKNKNKRPEGELSFYFKRNYEVYTIKKLFSTKKIFNAYSGDQLKKDRIIGDVQLKIVLTGCKKNNDNNRKFLNQLKDYATSDLATCVSEQEVSDPLLFLDGFIQIQNYKKKSRYLDISNKDFKFSSKGSSQEKINQCMESKLKLFKFKKTFPSPFRAKILFESF